MKTLTDEEYENLVKKASYQDAKKPKFRSNGYSGVWSRFSAYCPRCENELDDGDIFCSECGQRIDWSEEEDGSH